MNSKGGGVQRAAAESQPPEKGKILQTEREEMGESRRSKHLCVK